jgi:hypothetical protein
MYNTIVIHYIFIHLITGKLITLPVLIAYKKKYHLDSLRIHAEGMDGRRNLEGEMDLVMCGRMEGGRKRRGVRNS